MESVMQASQASSHFPLEPVSASTLFELETARRESLGRSGTFRTGCTEVDEQVLVDGFERGAVVGISAEEIDTGLLLAMQTIAHNLVFGPDEKPALRRAAIITTLAPPVILPTLRDVIKAQVQVKLGKYHVDIGPQVRKCLERISVSRVFDMEGLWEVLSELEEEVAASSPEPGPEPEVTAGVRPGPEGPEEPESSPLSSAPSSSPVTELPPLRTERVERTEVMDSEDEEELSSLSSLSSASPVASDLHMPTTASPALPVLEPSPVENEQTFWGEGSQGPGIILITHFSTLLNALFTQRDKSSAHTTLQLLSSHLRYLSRTSGPLIMLLNSTTNTPSNRVANSAAATPSAPGPPGKRPSERPLDPTLRSIFNPPPPAHAGYGAGSVALSRKNKPAFGLTFTQFLDLHLLCTQLPKTRADAEAVFAPTAVGAGRAKYVWIVEVLLDESGFWDRSGERIDREQRWGAVDGGDGVRIFDAFERKERRQHHTDMFRLAAGFGGRRV